MFFSIIVPCYQCQDTIGPLLDSIIKQEQTQPGILQQIEVILVDDDENDHLWKPVVSAKYLDKLNIKFVPTDLHNHNPGNSRNYGMNVATGDWLVFMDCDDTLCEGSLKIFVDNIKTFNSPCHIGLIRFFDKNNQPMSDEECIKRQHLLYMHGKCYNRNYINTHNIRFMPTMKACEDYYFNYQVRAQMFNDGYEYNNIKQYMYNWLWNPNSLSRSDEYYMVIQNHIINHMQATLLPWVNKQFVNKNKIFEWYMKFLVGSYFLVQFYKGIGISLPGECYDVIKLSISKTWSHFNLTPFDLINYVEKHPDKYWDNYIWVSSTINERFVPVESFRDWMIRLMR